MILSLTPRTVNFHISSAMRKMGATNKTSAVVIAAKCGLL
ncbi:LuxR C-terminal-related transcriptional regulator [Pseudomonas helleri]|nr:LuxR C-terminal-related transcriptional regulator [Pseudomonas helleri]MCU1757814.1 LuxR C-terminal-related transcriptional regulator [Pseudomonas helleri]